MYPPVLQNNRTVIITVGTQSHSQLLNDERDNMIAFLKNKLEKKNIDLTINVDSEKAKIENKKRPYTPTEKFEFMANKNPILRELRDELKLETDF